MHITKDCVATFHYRLRHNGQELENSYDDEPMAYLHGHGNIVAGLEKALEGKVEGDTLSVTLEAIDAYGERQTEALQRVPIKHLAGNRKQNSKLRAGQVVSINTEQGVRQVVVVKAGKFNVDVDTNHPLAGKTLTFEIEIKDVREASAEEISHGHAHGLGGHQH